LPRTARDPHVHQIADLAHALGEEVRVPVAQVAEGAFEERRDVVGFASLRIAAAQRLQKRNARPCQLAFRRYCCHGASGLRGGTGAAGCR